MPQQKKLRIVFLGTPDFAVASLRALHHSEFKIVAVVTAPDLPAGRGQKIRYSPVKTYALKKGFPLLQPTRLKSPEFLAELDRLNADLYVVVAFRMLPETVWNRPPLGTLNVHASLLPQYRGAAPIHRAIMNGETETGITIFRLQQEIDTGPILTQTKIPVTAEETAGTLHDKLMNEGAALLVETIRKIVQGTIRERPQTFDPELKPAPKIFKEDRAIDWSRPGKQIINHIRGLSPYPAAFFLLNKKIVKIFQAHFEPFPNQIATPGSLQSDHSTFLRIAASDGWIYLDILQLEGKKVLPVSDFLRGFRSLD